jgi:membrane protein DedA with SNARE-associated domain
MLFAGFNVSNHHWSLVTITVVGVAGNVVGSWVAYGIGYYGRVELLERHGAKLHISQKHLATADRWFNRWGAPTVFFSRMLPVIRTFISLPAGVARMPFWRFTLYTAAGCIPWVLLLGFAGQQVGHRWPTWRHNLDFLDYIGVALIVGGIAYLLVRRVRRGREAVETPSA